MENSFIESQKVKQAWIIVLMITVTIFSIINYVQMPATFSSIAPLVIIFIANLIFFFFLFKLIDLNREREKERKNNE